MPAEVRGLPHGRCVTSETLLPFSLHRPPCNKAAPISYRLRPVAPFEYLVVEVQSVSLI